VAEAKVIVDPLDGPKLALAGRVVTMDDAFRVEADGVVYVEKGSVVPSARAPSRRLPASRRRAWSRRAARSSPA
jgi:hypothetical protein